MGPILGEGGIDVIPLFLAITPGMDVRFQGEGSGSHGGAGLSNQPRYDDESPSLRGLHRPMREPYEATDNGCGLASDPKGSLFRTIGWGRGTANLCDSAPDTQLA